MPTIVFAEPTNVPRILSVTLTADEAESIVVAMANLSADKHCDPRVLETGKRLAAHFTVAFGWLPGIWDRWQAAVASRKKGRR
jgi:hypothetical protein